MAATVIGLSILGASACGDGTTPTSVHGSSGVIGDGRVNTIKVAPATVSLEEGMKSALTCSPMDARGLVLSVTPAWTTSDASIATVSATGAVVGLRAGNATISCVVDGKTAASAVTVVTSPVAFVEVSPGAGTLVVGNSIQLSGIPRDANGAVVPGRDVQWSTTDTAVAMVSSSGSVVARVEGTANVIAMSGGKASMAKINVAVKTPAAVSSISIKVDDSSLNIGRFTHATATVTDETGQVLNGRSITWSVSDSKVASVVALNADKATVTALGQGSTFITATSEGVSTTAILTVAGQVASTAPAVQTVSVSLSSASIYPGQTTQATATLKDANGNVLTDRSITWASLDPSIAIVSQTGLVTAMATGAVIIRATSEGKTGDASLTVSVAPVTTVAVNLGTSTLAPGQTTQATAVAKDAYGNVLTGRSVSWSSLNPGIATVSISGVVTSVTTGSATIRATVESKAGEAPLTVATTTTVAPVATVTVSLAAPSLAPGQTTQATAVAKDVDGNVLTGRSVSWSSLTPSVATVSSTGVVTAVAAGSATIRATVETKTGDSPLTVATSTPAAVAAVSVSLASATLNPGQTTQATAVATDASGAVLTGRTVTWSSLNTAVATVSSAGVVTAVSAGSATIRATVETKTGDGPLTVSSPTVAPTTPTDAELPRTYLTTSTTATPSTGRTLTVAAGGNLQAALDSAQAGDKIVLACGASFAGNFILQVKSGTAWTTLTSSGCANVAEGQRMTPSLAANLPKIKSLLNSAALRTAVGAHHWRVSLLEITNDASAANNTWGMISLGQGNETSLSQVPSNIILDRLYIHATTGLDVRRGVTNNGASVAVVDSWISDIHSTFDAVGIGGWNGPGPYKYVNNYIEASGEGIASGGADPTIANLVPSDFEIRRNHITKNLAWRGTWIMKNLIEFKNAQRALIDGNVLENSPVDAQAGFAFVLWSVNQQNTAPWSVTQHITVTNNLIRQVAAGFQLDAKYYATSSPAMNHVTIRNNVILGLDAAPTNGNGRIFQISNVIPQLTIEHNTAFSPSNSTFIWNNAGALPDHRILNNLAGGGMYQIFNGLQGKPAWDLEAGPGSAFLGNVVALFSGYGIDGNAYPAALADLGLVGGATAPYSASATIDQLALSAGSQFKGKATDGTDPGANIPAVLSATSNVKLP